VPVYKLFNRSTEYQLQFASELVVIEQRK